MITSKDTAELLLDNLYKRFGLPDKIISDRGPQFAAKAFRELMKFLGITSSLMTAYHPQSDGATERVNQEIEAYIPVNLLYFQSGKLVKNSRHIGIYPQQLTTGRK